MTRSRRRRSTCWQEGEEEEVDDDDGTEEEGDDFHKDYKGESSSTEIVYGSASCGMWLSLSLPLAPRSTPGRTGSKSEMDATVMASAWASTRHGLALALRMVHVGTQALLVDQSIVR